MKRITLTCLATATLLAGCQIQPATPESSHLMLGPGVSQYLSIDAQPGGITDGGLLRQGVRVHNRSHSTRKVRFRVVWFDNNGFELAGLSSRWAVHTLRPDEPVTLSRIATAPNATNYRIDLFPAQVSQASSTEGSMK